MHFVVGIYMGLYVWHSCHRGISEHQHSDGPLFAFSLFTPTIINEVSELFVIVEVTLTKA